MGHKPHHWSLHQSTWENAALISCIDPRGGEPQAQTETSCSGTKLILHGCEVPGLLSHHSGLQPCPNRRILHCLLHSTVPANWWPLPPYGRMLLPQEGGCLSTRQTRYLIGT